jgi:acyl dehydratase
MSNESRESLRSQVYWEDVAVGTELPPLVKGPFTVMELAKFGAMIGDFYPTHYDHKWATEKDRVPAVIVYGLQMTVHLSQLLTRWIGPDGFLRRLKSEIRSPTYVGDTVTLRGKITAKYVIGNEHLADCEVWGEKQDGSIVERGSATVVLPSKMAA